MCAAAWRWGPVVSGMQDGDHYAYVLPYARAYYSNALGLMGRRRVDEDTSHRYAAACIIQRTWQRRLGVLS